jgi:hypothetical protein
MTKLGLYEPGVGTKTGGRSVEPSEHSNLLQHSIGTALGETRVLLTARRSIWGSPLYPVPPQVAGVRVLA